MLMWFGGGLPMSTVIVMGCSRASKLQSSLARTAYLGRLPKKKMRRQKTTRVAGVARDPDAKAHIKPSSYLYVGATSMAAYILKMSWMRPVRVRFSTCNVGRMEA